eukprot:Gb_20101 [translate_table: standard]
MIQFSNLLGSQLSSYGRTLNLMLTLALEEGEVTEESCIRASSSLAIFTKVLEKQCRCQQFLQFPVDLSSSIRRLFKPTNCGRGTLQVMLRPVLKHLGIRNLSEGDLTFKSYITAHYQILSHVAESLLSELLRQSADIDVEIGAPQLIASVSLDLMVHQTLSQRTTPRHNNPAHSLVHLPKQLRSGESHTCEQGSECSEFSRLNYNAVLEMDLIKLGDHGRLPSFSRDVIEIVGNWSRLLTNLVGIDEEYSPREGCIEESKMDEIEAPFNSFSLLNATSDLLMLPKDMLLDISVRKESPISSTGKLTQEYDNGKQLCPVLSSPLIRRVLSNFGPDEFCPDPLPSSLLAALDDEILLEHRLQGREDSTYSTLVSSPPVKYSPPPAACVKEWIGDTNGYIHFGSNTSSVLRKGHTSDDELDELESPLSSLVEEIPATLPPITKLHSNGKSGGTLKQHVDIGGKDRRYQLLREVWAGK